jgi:hypothetical protein
MAKYAEAAPKILEYLEQGMTNDAASEKAGINMATFYSWMNEKSDFHDAVQRAKEVGTQNAIRDVEAALLNLAKGVEWEDVRTEYASELNPATGKYEPVIKKQVRTKKCIPANTEAIKFFLTNKAPAEWKNRNEHEIANIDALKNLRIERVKGSREDSGMISHSEADVEE